MVEIIPKPAEKVIWKEILSYFPIFLLILIILVFFILNSYQKKLEIYLQSLEDQISKGKIQEIKNLEKEILDKKEKIDIFKPLLESHLFNTNFFNFLASSTHPQVFFSKVDLNSKEATVSLSGQTDSFSTLGQQILIFSQKDLISDLNLTNFSISKEGKVNFDLKLKLNPKIFQK